MLQTSKTADQNSANAKKSFPNHEKNPQEYMYPAMMPERCPTKLALGISSWVRRSEPNGARLRGIERPKKEILLCFADT